MNGLEQLGGYLADLAGAATTPAAWAVALGLIGFVFVWSATAKLRSPFMTALAIVDFGVAKHARLQHAWLLGGAELALGIALLATVVSSWAPAPIVAAIACLALWGFSALIARALTSARSFACFCFGSETALLSWATFARTAGLAVIATWAFALTVGQPAPLAASETVLALLVAAALVATAALASAVAATWTLPEPSVTRAVAIGDAS